MLAWDLREVLKGIHSELLCDCEAYLHVLFFTVNDYVFYAEILKKWCNCFVTLVAFRLFCWCSLTVQFQHM